MLAWLCCCSFSLLGGSLADHRHMSLGKTRLAAELYLLAKQVVCMAVVDVDASSEIKPWKSYKATNSRPLTQKEE